MQENFLNVETALHEQNRLNDFSPCTNTYLKRIKYGNTSPYSRTELTAYNPPAPLNAGYMFEAVFDFGDYDENIPYLTCSRIGNAGSNRFLISIPALKFALIVSAGVFFSSIILKN